MKKLTSIIGENTYLSFDSALSNNGIIDQIIFNLKFASLYDSFDINTELGRAMGIVLPRDLFFGYEKGPDFNIAKPEKALLDQIWYCEDTGQIFNPEDVDWDRLNKHLLEAYADTMGVDYKRYLSADKSSKHPKEAYRFNRMESFLIKS